MNEVNGPGLALAITKTDELCRGEYTEGHGILEGQHCWQGTMVQKQNEVFL